MNGVKESITIICGLFGSLISTALGGWDHGMTTLIIFMAIDYITGLIVGGVFKKSPKTKTGALQSKAGLMGLLRKGAILLMVLVACRLDMTIGSNFIRDATVIAFIANETISIVENIGLMGVKMPKVIEHAIDLLKQKEDEHTNNKK